MLGRAAFALLLAFAASGCSTPGENLPELESRSLAPYRLGIGDEVRVTVFGLDALTNTYLVADDGTVSMPLLDRVELGGKTTEEAETVIEQRLRSAKIIQDPSASVQVTRYRPFYILGEVQKPGAYPYAPGMTLLTAVALAGGYTFRAETDYASVVRTDDGSVQEGRVTPKTPILPGDTVYVYESWF